MHLTVHAANVTDQDTDDPPDAMAADRRDVPDCRAPPVVDDAPPSSRRHPATTPLTSPAGQRVVTFDEPVDVSGDWFDSRARRARHSAVVSGGPVTFSLDRDRLRIRRW